MAYHNWVWFNVERCWPDTNIHVCSVEQENWVWLIITGCGLTWKVLAGPFSMCAGP